MRTNCTSGRKTHRIRTHWPENRLAGTKYTTSLGKKGGGKPGGAFFSVSSHSPAQSTHGESFTISYTCGPQYKSAGTTRSLSTNAPVNAPTQYKSAGTMRPLSTKAPVPASFPWYIIQYQHRQRSVCISLGTQIVRSVYQPRHTLCTAVGSGGYIDSCVRDQQYLVGPYAVLVPDIA
eukprot:651924-Rhodomonas_salina.1